MVEKNSVEKNLDIVRKFQKDILLLSRTDALLEWDESTYMPSDGIEYRSEQHALLHGMIHDKMISDELSLALEALRGEDLSEEDSFMVKRVVRETSKAKMFPRDFVERMSMANSRGFAAWQDSKKKNDFSIFAPFLERIVELKREEVSYSDVEGHSYNALIDNFEEGMTVERLEPIFEKLRVGLVALLKRIEGSEKYSLQKRVSHDFNLENQKKLSLRLAEIMGFFEERLRIDASEHPFTTTIGFGDVRITSNFDKGIVDNFSSTIHELGHALYESNFREGDKFSFLGDSPSFGLHESQSRFWENMVGKGVPFQHYFFPEIADLFGVKEDFEDWYFNLNLVERGKIRVASDEVHYCLHIILRFELERGLIDGSIEVSDLPGIWSDKMREYFGVEVENDSEGVLQDVHWSSGLFGYFPSYALGSIYAVQLYNQMKRDLPGVEGDIFSGKMGRVISWLNEKVHVCGARKLADDLVRDVCGEGLNVEEYLEYLDEKYSRIYEL